jgi:beclin
MGDMESPVVVQCQQCKARLEIVPSSSGHVSDNPEPNPPAPYAGMSSRLEESFMLLEEVLGRHAGDGTVEEDASFIVLDSGRQRATSSRDGNAASESRRPPLPGAGTTMPQLHGNIQHTSQQQPSFSLYDRMETVARVLELASEEASVDQPLCSDCAGEVLRELQAQADDLEAELAAYKALESRLNAEAAEGQLAVPMDERTFQRTLKRAQEAAREEEERLAEAEAALAAAQARNDAVDAASRRLDAVEDDYWHAFNACMLALHSAEDRRDALQARVDAAERSAEILRRTNVLNDVFAISKDGPFGTISGLRLGSMPDTPVEWAEINAAWGHAVLLLDTLCRILGFTLPNHRLEPRGSYSRVHDSRGANDLYGPVTKVFCMGYDRAQVAYLQILKAVGEELARRGALDHEGKAFALPFSISNDRVKDQSVRYTLSRDKGWTKALKYMLADLKWCLKGTLALMDKRRAAVAAHVSALPREGPM